MCEIMYHKSEPLKQIRPKQRKNKLTKEEYHYKAKTYLERYFSKFSEHEKDQFIALIVLANSNEDETLIEFITNISKLSDLTWVA